MKSTPFVDMLWLSTGYLTMQYLRLFWIILMVCCRRFVYEEYARCKKSIITSNSCRPCMKLRLEIHSEFHIKSILCVLTLFVCLLTFSGSVQQLRASRRLLIRLNQPRFFWWLIGIRQPLVLVSWIIIILGRTSAICSSRVCMAIYCLLTEICQNWTGNMLSCR
jgi:hypothetical protein